MLQTAKWDFVELKFQTEKNDSYFHGIVFGAVFTQGDVKKRVNGFYDDNGCFLLRFMPENEGVWSYETFSNLPALNGQKGEIECLPAQEGVRGPVRVDEADKRHFAYADGTPYYPFGTTAYVWIYQKPEIQKETMESLAKAPFNKIRMCIFPKHYDYNLREPEMTPFPGDIEHGFDYSRYNCAFFHKLEEQLMDLQKLGIEADIILFHPYDRWGFCQMPEEVDLEYVSYIVARLSAFRHVWWSLANEYDLMKAKTKVFWDKVFNKLVDEDPYGHLRSIHNWHLPTIHYRSNAHWYDHTREWVTHASIQHHDMRFVPGWEEQFDKPIMIDECRYEGNMDLGWGNMSGEEMADLFWQAVVYGGYATHGETYMNEDEIIWWAHGGRLLGTSPERIAFLRKIVEEGPAKRLKPLALERHWDAFIGRNADEGYWLIYFGPSCPKYRHLDMLPEGKKYHADIIDTWEMTIDSVPEIVDVHSTLDLRSKKYIAIRLTEVKD